MDTVPITNRCSHLGRTCPYVRFVNRTSSVQDNHLWVYSSTLSSRLDECNIVVLIALGHSTVFAFDVLFDLIFLLHNASLQFFLWNPLSTHILRAFGQGIHTFCLGRMVFCISAGSGNFGRTTAFGSVTILNALSAATDG